MKVAAGLEEIYQNRGRVSAKDKLHGFLKAKQAPFWDDLDPEQKEKALEASMEEIEQDDNAMPWPEPLDAAAFYGLAGETVKKLSPFTEADEAALLMNFLAAMGNAVGRAVWWEVSGTKHYCNLFAALVGNTAKGRKGTSWGPIRELMLLVDEDWGRFRHVGGLSSGEGLVWQVRDEIYRIRGGKEELEDKGESDKRLLIIEGEFGRGLKAMAREGNTLSAMLREAWDGPGVWRSLTKKDNTKATNPHVSLLAHVTRQELRKEFAAVEVFNGLGNRFLWCCVRRSKLLPFGGGDMRPVVEELSLKIRPILAWILGQGNPVHFTTDAMKVWEPLYGQLTADKAGLIGAALGRAEAQIRRLAVLYAALDRREKVDVEHLMAACAVWQYCERSAGYIFGADSEEKDEAQEKIMAFLKERGEATQTELSVECFKRHGGQRLKDALESLSAGGKIEFRKEVRGNKIRQTKVWFLKQ